MESKVYFSFKEALSKTREGQFFLSYRNQLYPFWWKIKDPKVAFTVFFPGRTNRAKDIPVFQRKSYAEDVEANVISIFDPSLFKSRDLGIAWCVGDRHNFYSANIGKLLNVFFGMLGTPKVLVYGSSAGGIPAFFASNEIENPTTLYCNNIQTDASKYYPQHFLKMVDTCFPAVSESQLFESFMSRMAIVGKKCNAYLVYSQNIADSFHYQEHYLPFKQSFDGEGLFVEYDDPASGHDVLPRDSEIGIVNSILEGSLNLTLFPGIKNGP